MPRAISPSARALRLAFVASLALFARVLDASRADQQSNETLDPLSELRAHPELPRELRLPLRAASAALADAGLAPRAADAIARYGGADRVARDLALVLAAATAACGDGREKAAEARASAAVAAARAGPLRALFSGLTHELALRTWDATRDDESHPDAFSASRLLSAEDPYLYDVSQDARGSSQDVRAGARFVVDALDEASASLAGSAAPAAEARGSPSCFAGAGGVVTRTLRALGILADDLESVVATLRERSADELSGCGLGASALDAENERDATETTADVETLAYFAARAEACRRRGRVEAPATTTTGEAHSVTHEERSLRDAQLWRLRARTLAAHLALGDALETEAKAAERRRDFSDENGVPVSAPNRSCLGERAFPPRDPNWDAPKGASLLTSTGALAFVVAALRDVTLTESACARALDAPDVVFFASPALDAVAQEAAEAGVFPAAAAWLAAAPSGSAGLEASVDEAQAAARACAVASSGNANATEADLRGTSWIRVERGPTRAALAFLRRLEAATLGRRNGSRGYSAVSRLVRALETLLGDLEKRGCLSSEPTIDHPASVKTSANEVGKSRRDGSEDTPAANEATTTSRSRATAARAAVARDPGRDPDVETLAELEDRSSDGSGDASGTDPGTSAPSATSDLILGVLFGLAALALVAAAAGAVAARRRAARPAARKRRVSATFPADDRSAAGDLPRLSSDRSSLLGGSAAGSARRFYRHLEAGSAGDLPLVEDLDRVASLPGARSPAASGSPGASSPRPSTPPSTPYASSAFFAPASRRRSHSISEPLAARAPLPPRHERRHTTRAEDV